MSNVLLTIAVLSTISLFHMKGVMYNLIEIKRIKLSGFFMFINISLILTSSI